MQERLVCSLVMMLMACGKTEPASSPAGKSPPPSTSGSAAAEPASPPPAAVPPATADTAGSGASDGSDEVVQLVVHDVGSKALGSQTIDPACVSVTIIPSGDWTIAAARLKDCGDKNARSILWLYKRKTGKWNEDYVGQPPKCWKGVPPDIAAAVTTATKIPHC